MPCRYRDSVYCERIPPQPVSIASPCLLYTSGTDGYVVDVEAKCTVGSVSQWVYDTYGIVIPNDCGIIAFSPDLTHIWGVGQRGYALGGVIPYVWYIAPPLRE